MSKRLQAGKDLLEKGQFEQAIKEFSIEISSNKDDIQAVYLRGIAYRKVGNLDASLFFEKIEPTYLVCSITHTKTRIHFCIKYHASKQQTCLNKKRKRIEY